VSPVTRRRRTESIWPLFAAGLALAPATAVARDQALPFPTVSTATSETVTFGDGTGRSVTVIRGPSKAAPAPQPVAPMAPVAAFAKTDRRVETVTFTNPDLAPVTIIRGEGIRGRATANLGPSLGLFAPASGGELDRVAFAVEGVESGHGTNLAMWRPGLDGPQGPMQISASAALDVGGGDRFDLRANRHLGKAFLARMYERYGNWPDALAGYNWGPGNTDAWIAAGRPENRLPFETARYIEMVLRDAVIGKVRL
jgi:hypothetical protein